VPAATVPVSVRPSAGSGSSQTMTFTFTDPRGWKDLDVVNVLIESALDAHNACYLAYSRAPGVLYLVDDAGASLLQGLNLGAPGTAGAGPANSQCSVTSASVMAGANNLVLTVNLNFSAGFKGNKIVYLAARDLQGSNSGWQPLGTWRVPGSSTFPSVDGVSPGHGVASTTFSFNFTDSKGSADLGVINVLVNSALDAHQACYVAYVPSINQMYLVNDAGSGLLPGLVLNGPNGIPGGTTANAQCAVKGWLTIPSSSTLTLNVQMTFNASSAGNKIVYAAARDSAEDNNSGWQVVGTVTIPGGM